MRALRKIDMLLRSEQPLNNSIQFLTTCQSKTMEALRCLGHVKTQQPEWCLALLMTWVTVPQAHHQRPDRFVGRVDVISRSKFAAPQRLHGVDWDMCSP